MAECLALDDRGGGAQLAAAKAKWAARRKVLESRLQKKKDMQEAYGLPKAEQALYEAGRAEERAAVAVMLAVPANSAELQDKRIYMAGKDQFTHHWWDGNSLFSALMANLEGVA